jgi:hypothetical protein
MENAEFICDISTVFVEKIKGTHSSSAFSTQILLGMFMIWRGEVCTGFWWGSLREGYHWGDPGVDGRIILRWIFRKWGGGMNGAGSGWGRVAGTCEYGNEISCSINVGNFLTD